LIYLEVLHYRCIIYTKKISQAKLLNWFSGCVNNCSTYLRETNYFAKISNILFYS